MCLNFDQIWSSTVEPEGAKLYKPEDKIGQMPEPAPKRRRSGDQAETPGPRIWGCESTRGRGGGSN